MNKLLLASSLTLACCTASFGQGRTPFKGPIHSLVTSIETQTSAAVIATSDKSEYQSEEPIKLTIALQNKGTKPIDIKTDAIENFYQIEVVGPDGKQLPMKQAYLPSQNGLDPLGAIQQYTVAPGQTKRAVVWLSNLFDMSAPGTYRVNAGPLFEIGQGSKVFVSLKAEVVAIEVLSAPSLSQWLD